MLDDISNASTLLKFVLFADDTSMFCSGNDALHLINIICMELNLIHGLQ